MIFLSPVRAHQRRSVVDNRIYANIFLRVDGVVTPRPHTPSGGESEAPSKSVQFDLPPEKSDHRREHRSRGRGKRSGSPDSVSSDSTVDLPARFDDRGRRLPERGEDPLADKIEELLHGRGTAGKLFAKITGDLFNAR